VTLPLHFFGGRFRPHNVFVFVDVGLNIYLFISFIICNLFFLFKPKKKNMFKKISRERRGPATNAYVYLWSVWLPEFPWLPTEFREHTQQHEGRAEKKKHDKGSGVGEERE